MIKILFLIFFPLARINDQKLKIREKRNSVNRFSNVFIEMWIIMLSGPSNRLPSVSTERIFLATCLFSNLIFAGSFQVMLIKHKYN